MEQADRGCPRRHVGEDEGRLEKSRASYNLPHEIPWVSVSTKHGLLSMARALHLQKKEMDQISWDSSPRADVIPTKKHAKEGQEQESSCSSPTLRQHTGKETGLLVNQSGTTQQTLGTHDSIKAASALTGRHRTGPKCPHKAKMGTYTRVRNQTTFSKRKDE